MRMLLILHYLSRTTLRYNNAMRRSDADGAYKHTQVAAAAAAAYALLLRHLGALSPLQTNPLLSAQNNVGGLLGAP